MLVIGVNKYKHHRPLDNAVRDATAISEKFRAKGAQVFAAYDCTKAELEEVMSAFFASIQPGDAVLIYFAGHGCEYNNANRLMLISESEEPMIREDSLNVLVLTNRFVHCETVLVIAPTLNLCTITIG